MNERERVLQLVKQGVISTEEALILLESMATEKNDSEITQAHPVDKQSNNKTVDLDEKRLEKVLDELATKATQTSAELDKVNEELAQIDAELEKTGRALADNQAAVSQSENTDQEAAQLAATLAEKEQKLVNERERLNQQKAQLQDDLDDMKEQRSEKSEKTERSDSNQENSEAWREQTAEALQQVGSTLSGIFKKTWTTVSQAVQENIDWKEVSLKVPGINERKFEHTFTYPDIEASILDIKVANGSVVLEPWSEKSVKIEADIKLLGKMDEDTALESFLARSQLEVDDEKVVVHLPSKRMISHLKVFVPERTYDYISFKLLNGDVTVSGIHVNDLYAKSTNGDLIFEDTTVTLLELEGINGLISVKNSHIHDLIANSINGSVILRDAAKHSSVSLVNGDIRYTVNEQIPQKIVLKTGSGSVKVALPETLGIEAEASALFGSIKNKMTGTETIREKRENGVQTVQLRRTNEEEPVVLQLKTTAGSIYLKDCEQSFTHSEADEQTSETDEDMPE